MGAVVEIVPYDPSWPQIYRDVEKSLHALLKDAVKSIDHVGSTSVPGLASKPYIDVDVVLSDMANLHECRILMEGFGYEPRGSRYGDGVWAFMIRDPLPGRRVYLCPSDSGTHFKRMRFRDILRANAGVAGKYGELKQNLAHIYREDGDGYTRAKADFIENALKNNYLKEF
ncbi:GrpB family protein [Agrobacterium sp. rho-8.1]|nr:GrpB family protein [Agrobacterium sp. rho-8.1]